MASRQRGSTSKSQVNAPGVGVAFHLGEGTVGISTPNRNITSLVTRFLPDYATPLEQAEPDETFWITEDNGLWSVGLIGTEVVDTFRVLSDALNGLEQLIVTRLLAVTPGTAHVHATGTVRDSQAVLALGASGAGKTSIALNWSASGRCVLGDDVVLVSEPGIAHPFKRLFIVDPDMLERTRSRAEPSLVWLSDNEETWYDPRSGGGWAPAAPIGAIALIRYDPEVGLRADELGKPQAVSALLASLMPTGFSASEFFGCAVELVSRVPTVELTFSDASEAAEFLVTKL